jgi:hypothetical protein
VGSVTERLSPLKYRNFRLFFVGQLVSLTGSWMQNTAQGWLVYQLTGSKVLLGTVAAVGSLPMLLLFGVVGVFGWSYSVLLPAYATDILQVGESGYGALLSQRLRCAPRFDGGDLWGRVRPRSRSWAAVVVLAMLVLVVVTLAPLKLACLAVSGWGCCLLSTTNTLSNQRVGCNARAMMGIWALFGGMMPVGIESDCCPRRGCRDDCGGALVCAIAGLVTWWACAGNCAG